jgi:DNA-directed RNA polymerase specialized sigma24 family protein
MDDDFSISEFGALPRDEVLELLVQCISQLSPTQKTILALYYHEDLEPAEIAACVGLTEGEFDQVRAETVRLLRTMLTAQIVLPELPASFDEPQKADGADVLVNG